MGLTSDLPTRKEVECLICSLEGPSWSPSTNQMAGYNDNYAIRQMPGYEGRVARAVELVTAARGAAIPVIFVQERHARTHVDFGRELDGDEGIHCVEDDPDTALVPELIPQPDEYFLLKRRYSGFFGTDLEILLRGLKAETLVLCGALTDVCVHYTFVDAHQHDYHVRVAQDAVGGSSQVAHDASLTAMEYLQTGAVRASAEIVAPSGLTPDRHGQALPLLSPQALPTCPSPLCRESALGVASSFRQRSPFALSDVPAPFRVELVPNETEFLSHLWVS